MYSYQALVRLTKSHSSLLQQVRGQDRDQGGARDGRISTSNWLSVLLVLRGKFHLELVPSQAVAS